MSSDTETTDALAAFVRSAAQQLQAAGDALRAALGTDDDKAVR